MKKNLTVFLLAAAIIAFIGCESPFAEKLKPQNLAEGYGKVRVSVNGRTDKTGARTVFPSGLEDITYYYEFYTVENPIEPVESPDEWEEEGVFILAAGTYTVEVKAFKEGVEIAEGKSGKFDIVAGYKTNPVNVTLRPVIKEGLSGTFKFSVIFPFGFNANAYKYFFSLESAAEGGDVIHFYYDEAYNENENSIKGDLALEGQDSALFSAETTVPAGYYYFNITVHDLDEEVIAGKREVVHIYNGLQTEIKSEDGYKFTLADFPARIEKVSDWAKLSMLLISQDTASLRIIITEPIAFVETIEINRDVTIAANSAVTFSRGTTIDGSRFTGNFFNIIESGSLTLAVPNVSDSLTINGEAAESNLQIDSLVNVSGGVFTMNERVILKGNLSRGVYVNSGEFIMNGGEISGNTAPNDGYGYGGGVHNGGIFEMRGGEISGNNAQCGGGVYVGQNAVFNMSGESTIKWNIANKGGGVYVEEGGQYSNDGGYVSENTSEGDNDVYRHWFDVFKNELTALSGTSADNPSKIELKDITFTTSNNDVQEGVIGWEKINSAIQSAEKYIILDLSGSIADGNTISGSSGNIPSGNAMNIIYSNLYIKEIILPDTLQTIGNYAFCLCNNLTNVTIPNGVTSIGASAFYNCTSLTSINIPDSVETIGYNAFFECAGLTRVSLGSGVTIGDRAFGSNNTLSAAYTAGGAGTYIRTAGNDDWTGPLNADLAATVTFNSNGGSTVNPIIVTSGSTITLPTPPTRDGNTFAGWYKDNDAFTNKFTETTTVTSNITLYAKWTVTVTFNSNGGSEVETVTVTSGSTITSPPSPTRDGNTFVGWYKETALSNIWDFDNDTVSANITLYAKWTVNQYTVTFNSNGGSEVETVTVTSGSTITLPIPPTRDGNTFAGWYKDNYDFAIEFTETTTVTSNITLYAKWTVTVIFNSNGGSEVETVTVTSGFTITLPTPPTRDGNTFAGWFTDNYDFAIEFTETTTVTSDITVYAKWTLSQPQIEIWQETTNIAPSGEYDFGEVAMSASKEIEFTIANTGTVNLSLMIPENENNIVNFTPGTEVFEVTSQPFTNIILPGNSTTFKIKFTPAAPTSSFSSIVSIQTNSQNNAEFSFEVTGTVRYNIGEQGPAGGIVFYDNKGTAFENADWRYLEAAPADTEAITSSAMWAESGNNVEGTETSIGTGQKNTLIIVEYLAANPTVAGYAAQLCSSLTDNYLSNDWFLPSIEELNLMHQNIKELGEFNDGFYWSSSQSGSDYAQAYDFINGNPVEQNKGTPCLVRAIRAF